MDTDGTFTLITRLLRKTALTADESNQLTELIGEMIKNKVDDKVDALARQYAQLKWVIGIGLALLALMMGLMR